MEYKAYALMAILLASVAAIGTFGSAYAQSSGLSVKTDKTDYSAGDTITISGNVGVTPTGQPLVLQVYNPQGAGYRFDQVTVAADGSYTYPLKVGGPLGISGTYRTVVSYNGVSKETTFNFTAGQPEKVKLMIDGKAYDINYTIVGGTVKSLTGDPKTSTITAMITANADGNLTIQLPRNIADSKKTNNTDDEFGIFVDNIDEFADDDHGQTVRTLTIPFTAQSEQIDIVGTFVVPEFGAIAAIVLAVAIVGIIVATTRYSKFSFVPKM
ncbi:MAG TPA: PEFG-CTERM sorting domain-containing protein [Nitrososphaera sp.]|nr:PEFG-CTERM sorting domain-containing protein [Nitrososphaera sp.]